MVDVLLNRKGIDQANNKRVEASKDKEMQGDGGKNKDQEQGFTEVKSKGSWKETEQHS
jgi:hypothetical protein